MATLKELFSNLQSRFNADKAQGDKAMLSFQLSGEGGATYWMRIDNGTLEVGEGDAPTEADLILKADASDFIKIMMGEMNPMTAFMAGKIRAERNMGMAMKLMGWFGM